MSNCQRDVIIEIENLKQRVQRERDIKVSIEYNKCYNKLLKIYDQGELAEYWSKYEAVRETFHHHMRKSVGPAPATLSGINLEKQYVETDSGVLFLPRLTNVIEVLIL